MDSTDGINKLPNFAAELPQNSVSRELKVPAKSAEEYVEIETRLAAQREKPAENRQFTSIFDQLRRQLPPS